MSKPDVPAASIEQRTKEFLAEWDAWVSSCDPERAMPAISPSVRLVRELADVLAAQRAENLRLQEMEHQLWWPKTLLIERDALRAEVAAQRDEIADIKRNGAIRCYHCGEVVPNQTQADMHFGTTPDARPICRIPKADWSIAYELRKVEAERNALRAEVASQREALTQLRTFAQHKHDCAWWKHLPASGNRCDCGLDAALATSPKEAQ